MKKSVLILAVLLTAFSAGTNAQVAIGVDADPRDGAVLDLSQISSSDLGFLLPRVSLTTVSAWQLQGNSENGNGMMVFNTNAGTTGGTGKAGVYIWNEADKEWEPMKQDINIPDAVKVTGFLLNPAETTINVYAGEEVEFTASDFIPEEASYWGVTWSISSGSNYANITSRKLTSCKVKGLAAGTAKLSVVSVDGSVKKEVTVHVVAVPAPCTKPAAPTKIEFSRTTGLLLLDTITATATPPNGVVLPITYNWTVPYQFEIFGDEHSQTVKLVVQRAGNVTNGLKVNVENSCGAGNDFSNSTSINIFPCSEPPVQPGSVTLSKTTIAKGRSFTASIADPVPNATSYTWTVPDGMTITATSTNKRTITVKTSVVTTVNSGDVTVSAVNDCGPGISIGNDTELAVIEPGCPGVVIPGGVHTYSGGYYTGSGSNYNALISSGKFARDESHDLCVYYRDVESTKQWDIAVDFCANGLGVDAVDYDESYGWRLPNLAELGQMATNNATAPWSPKYNALAGLDMADSRTTNLSSSYYWSSSEYSAIYAWFWSYLSSLAGYSVDKANNYYVRCVRSL